MKATQLYKAVKDNHSRKALLDLLFRAANGETKAFLFLSLLRTLVKNGVITDPVCKASLLSARYGESATRSNYKIRHNLIKYSSLDDAITKAFDFEFGFDGKPKDIMRAMYWHFVSTNFGNISSALPCTRIYLWHHAYSAEFDSNPNQFLVDNMIGWNTLLFNRGIVDAAVNVAFLYQILALKSFKLEVSDAIWWLNHAKTWIKEAVKWLEMAAEKGDALAAFNLGITYLLGAISKNEGIEPNVEKAIKWFTKSYSLGGTFGALAAHHLSNIYFSDTYNKINKELGVEWHEKFVCLNCNMPPNVRRFLYTLLLNLYCTPFTTPGSSRRHFLKHGEELGCEDLHEYQDLAMQVQSTGTPILYRYGGRDIKAYIKEISDKEVIFVAANDRERIRTCHLKRRDISEDMTRILPRPTSFFASPMLPTVSFGR